MYKLVYFYKDNCGKCEGVLEMVKRLSEEFKGKALIVGRINMSRNEIAEMIGFNVPMLAVLRSFDDEQSSTFDEEWDYGVIRKWVYSKV